MILGKATSFLDGGKVVTANRTLQKESVLGIMKKMSYVYKMIFIFL